MDSVLENYNRINFIFFNVSHFFFKSLKFAADVLSKALKFGFQYTNFRVNLYLLYVSLGGLVVFTCSPHSLETLCRLVGTLSTFPFNDFMVDLSWFVLSVCKMASPCFSFSIFVFLSAATMLPDVPCIYN